MPKSENIINTKCQNCDCGIKIKFCKKCDSWKNSGEFDKRCQQCKDCKRELNKNYYEKKKLKDQLKIDTNTSEEEFIENEEKKYMSENSDEIKINPVEKIEYAS